MPLLDLPKTEIFLFPVKEISQGGGRYLTKGVHLYNVTHTIPQWCFRSRKKNLLQPENCGQKILEELGMKTTVCRFGVHHCSTASEQSQERNLISTRSRCMRARACVCLCVKEGRGGTKKITYQPYKTSAKKLPFCLFSRNSGITPK